MNRNLEKILGYLIKSSVKNPRTGKNSSIYLKTVKSMKFPFRLPVDGISFKRDRKKMETRSIFGKNVSGFPK